MEKLFKGGVIRSVWDSELEEYYFNVVVVIGALTNSTDPSDYWTTLKRRLKKDEKSELPTKCRKLYMTTSKGRNYPTDVLDTEGIFRLIESVPSPNAEPLKLWLAGLGKERVDEIFDPSLGIDKMIDYYLRKGYTLEWIELRIQAIINRKKLVSAWEDNGINEDVEKAILTNEIYKTWSGMTASEYKSYKGIRKENLRDNMSDIEVALTDLGELATRELVKTQNPKGLEENKEVAKIGGSVAKNTRDDLERKLGKSVITNRNNLPYEYENNKKIDIK